MRNILFRGKTISTNKWIYGGYFTMDDRHFIVKAVRYCPDTRDWDVVEYYENNPTYTHGLFEVHPESVGEYTGLLDKDGKNIFEGDIILFGDEPLVVYWNGECFQWQARKQSEPHPCKRYPQHNWDHIDLGWIAAEVPVLGKMTTQVGGNIYDDPQPEPDEDEWKDVWF